MKLGLGSGMQARSLGAKEDESYKLLDGSPEEQVQRLILEQFVVIVRGADHGGS